MTPGVCQGSEGSRLSALQTDKSKGELPEEEGHLVNFAQVYTRWLNKSPLCSCFQGVHTSEDRAWFCFYLILLLLSHYSNIMFPEASTEFMTGPAWRQEVMQAMQQPPEAGFTPAFPKSYLGP